MNFKDRRIWITGASSGIGEAMALAFHQAGAKLIL
ncbi:MAG TPA: short-chain dehydrogenase, partial [Candidatus Angelobacter sp.]|nr:short-chain dehydrogenase [Candidatus Angelobacter sp.]